MLKQAFVATTAVFIGMLLNYLFNIIMVRVLEPSLYGELSILVGLLTIITVPATALQIVLTREISKLDKMKKEDKILFLTKHYLKKMLVYGIIFSLAIILISYAFKPLIGSAIFYFQVVSIGIPAIYMLAVLRSYLRGKERISMLSVTSSVEPLLKVLLGFFLVSIGLSLLGATLSLWLGSLITFLVFAWIIAKKSGVYKPLRFNKSFSLILFTNVFIMLFLYSDLFFVRFYLGAEETAFYNVAAITSRVLYFAVGGVITVLLPKASKLLFKKHGSEIKSLIKKSMLFILPIFLVFVLFPSQIISVFYTERYAIAVNSFRILSLGMLAFGFFNIFLNVMWSQSKETFLAKMLLFVLVLNALLLSYLTPLYSIAGAALSTTISSFIMLIFSYMHFRSHLRK